ncbi:MAG TPA: DNA gyrase inhibitor YacG [Terriglobia bacterium]|nr:DNA gyrase inhibitor YacG [Terriglobia bacterium]
MAAHRPMCPICKREVGMRNNPFRPFCSERCKMIDLSHWLAGKYCISSPIAKALNEGGDSVSSDRSGGAEAEVE